MSQPAGIAVNWSFDKPDYDKLVAGVESHSMEEKWDISFDGETLHFYRSWTGSQIYNFTIKRDGNSYTVDSFNVEQDESRYQRSDDADEKHWLSLILEHVVGVKPHEQ